MKYHEDVGANISLKNYLNEGDTKMKKQKLEKILKKQEKLKKKVVKKAKKLLKYYPAVKEITGVLVMYNKFENDDIKAGCVVCYKKKAEENNATKEENAEQRENK